LLHSFSLWLEKWGCLLLNNYNLNSCMFATMSSALCTSSPMTSVSCRLEQ
jgi:hypothetical protein